MDLSPELVLITGLVAGFIHALTGPDHLSAIAPLAIESRKAAWKIGLFWGLGHSGGIWILAVILFFFRNLFPIAQLSRWSEKAVGIVLIGIGIWSIRRVFQKKIHIHSHHHDGIEHCHIHYHEETPAVSSTSPLHEHSPHYHTHASLGIGLLHGVAGSNHFLGALPVLAFPTQTLAALYVLGFGLGAILGMIVFSFFLSRMVFSRLLDTKRKGKWLNICFGSLAIGVGLFWLFGGGE
ncbi:nickel transporter [Methylacidiphilum kamchatkense]|uniref:ABC-type nickel/cobalt efflux system permease component RcnA n=1 Tax=Methylacidiphilum kamchatkense Kam1 TaxID=1202785 RepID=A0A516TLL6_9BACT|nr:nickel transporter [Methylacidiphilum kamchatkense]QDQ42074.1 ABC-type nickel/cobalt efflux system permease component RcnA [Methylacidiphilum kamchatkense Kam1]